MKNTNSFLEKIGLALLLFIGSGVMLNARQEYATPEEVYIARYPKEIACLLISGRSYEIIYRDRDLDRYYISFPGETAYIVLLEDKNAHKYIKSHWSKDSEFGDGHFIEAFVPEKDIEIKADHAYLVFSPLAQYPIRSRTDSTYKLEYELGETRLAVGVPRANRFAIHDYELSGFELTHDYQEMEPRHAICRLENSEGEIIGRGTLVREDGAIYCLTSQGSLTRHDEIKLKSRFDDPIDTTALELSYTKNLARFRIYGERYALKIAANPDFSGEMKVVTEAHKMRSKVIGNNLSTGNLILSESYNSPGFPILDHRGQLAAITKTIIPKKLAIPLDGDPEWLPVKRTPHADNRAIWDAELLLSEFSTTLLSHNYSDTTDEWKFLVRPDRHSVESASELFTHPLYEKWLSYKTSNHKRRLRLAKANPGFDKRLQYRKDQERSWSYLSNLLRTHTYKLKEFNPNPSTMYLEARKKTATERLEEVYQIALTSEDGDLKGSDGFRRIIQISGGFSRIVQPLDEIR